VIRLKVFYLVLLCSFVACLPACKPGKRPFLIVQLCLKDDENLAAFKNLLESTARSEHMNFIDGSDQTKLDLQSIAEVIHTVPVNNPVINVGVERDDGIGLMAGNLGLHNYEVAVGFSEGLNPSEAHKFANLVVGSLEKRWHVDVVPAGSGALPKDSCRDVSVH